MFNEDRKVDQEVAKFKLKSDKVINSISDEEPPVTKTPIFKMQKKQAMTLQNEREDQMNVGKF